jgi:hypothetical protein
MTALVNPALVINNEPVAYKPNSLSYNDGFPEVSVRTKTTGGGNVQTVIGQDIETSRGSVKFTLISEISSVATVKQWMQNLENNAIELSQDGFTRTFTKAIVTNKPDINAGMDGEIEVEFESNPAI